MGDLAAPNTGPTRLRALLRGEGLIVAPGAYDALSARLIEQAGFDVVYMTGYGASASLLGRPDIGLLSFAEMADQARRLVQAVTLPVIADADTGYGNPINVVRTVREYAACGVAALHLEDQAIPKRCGHMGGKEIISRQAMVAKVRAAVHARGASELVLIARSDARAGEGLERAIERVASYRDAGADVVFIDALQSEAEIVAFGAALPDTPKVINWVEGGLTPLISPDLLRELNYRIVFCSLATLLAATQAIRDRLASLLDLGAPQPPAPLGFSQFNDVIGMADVEALERRFADAGA